MSNSPTAANFWDYSALASHYERRAPYDASAVRAVLDDAQITRSAKALDIGAGTGRLSTILAAEGLQVDAIEPNDAMRRIGQAATCNASVTWRNARGESTEASAASVDIVTYGSSFNVLDRAAALNEAARVLRERGWIALVWNHRDLDDPLQRNVESAIRAFVPDYAYGARREDPSEIVAASRLFDDMRFVERRFVHRTSADDFIDGFRAHATLIRQAGTHLPAILDAMKTALEGRSAIDVPFTTRVWYCQRRRT